MNLFQQQTLDGTGACRLVGPMGYMGAPKTGGYPSTLLTMDFTAPSWRLTIITGVLE